MSRINFLLKGNPFFTFSAAPSSKPATFVLANAGSTTSATYQDVQTQSFEEIGMIVGGVAGASLYSLTAPITLIDGPLPFVDAAWITGLAYATSKASNLGRRIGSGIDSVFEWL
jgi:hypothetical protein